MRYWDASALVPLVVAEPGTNQVREWLAEDPHVVTWAWTQVEIAGAIERRRREGHIILSQRRMLLARFAVLAETWDEVTDVLATRARAIPLLGRHPLRAADAAQLAAALVVAEAGAASLAFVCLDVTLSTAAELEGLDVLPQPA